MNKINCYPFKWNDWDRIKKISIFDEDTPVMSFIPEHYTSVEVVIAGRSEPLVIEGKDWSGIKDPIYKDAYSKQFIKQYFAVCVHLFQVVKSYTILAGETRELTVELTRSSTMRTTVTKELHLEQVLEYSTENLRNSITSYFGISKVEEYCEEKSIKYTDTTRYEPKEVTRDIVFWDCIKVILLYRVNCQDKVDLIGCGDYLKEAFPFKIAYPRKEKIIV